MATTVMILGESGTGKSTAIRTIPVDQTAIIKVIGKPLPFRHGNQYKHIVSDSAQKIISTMRTISEKRLNIRYIVLDDYQYIMSNSYMKSLLEKGGKDSEFQKYKQIGYDAWSVINAAQALREDMIVFVLAHTDTDVNGRTKCKTIGKLLDEKITLEGLFTVVLNTHMHADRVNGERYVFQTQNNGANTTKSPMEMFDTAEIPNDLKLVADAINNYYGGENGSV